MSEDAGLGPAGTAEGQEGAEDAGTVSDDITEDGQEGAEEPDLAAQLADWKSKARQWENRSKANAKAASELAEIKKAGMSDAEKAQAELAEVTRERDEARTTHNRVMAAAANDLPVELIDYIPSGTEDEMNDHAETIARVIQETATQLASQMVAANQGQGRNGFAAARPVESMRAGSAPAGEQQPQNPNEWFRNLLDQR
jgi:hypothetical protein